MEQKNKMAVVYLNSLNFLILFLECHSSPRCRSEQQGGAALDAMFQTLQDFEKRICFTTGGICPHREPVVPLCVTEGFCGGKRGPKTGIERLVWKPFQYLDESDVAGALAKAGQYEGGSGHRLRPYPPLFTKH